MILLKENVSLKPWGRIQLPHPFINPGNERVGEIWFEPPKILDTLLVKYIFSSENLSVQCHPSDNQTLLRGLGRKGKEECWLVLDAEPGARLGIGFDAEITPEEMRKAALDGSIEALLTWHPVAIGDFFYIPANTVHAIGAGICLVEVQQNSDITYRLYDYGRSRELHLNEGVGVALGNTYPVHQKRHIPAEGHVSLVDGPFFRIDRLDGQPDPGVCRVYGSRPVLIIPLDCAVDMAGLLVRPGQCAVNEGIDYIQFPKSGRCLIAQSC